MYFLLFWFVFFTGVDATMNFPIVGLIKSILLIVNFIVTNCVLFFKCFGDGCKQIFCRYGAFKARFSRRYNETLDTPVTVGAAFTFFNPPAAPALCRHAASSRSNCPTIRLVTHVTTGRAVGERAHLQTNLMQLRQVVCILLSFLGGAYLTPLSLTSRPC